MGVISDECSSGYPNLQAGIMAVFHGLKVLFFGHSSPPRNAHVDSSVSPDDIEKFIKAFENKM